MSGRLLFTVVVLAVFVAAIVYTAICARLTVEAEARADALAMYEVDLTSATAGRTAETGHAPIGRRLDDVERSAA